MDLRFPTAEPSMEEVAALDAELGPMAQEGQWEREHGGVQVAASRRHLLLGSLHALQDRVGYISEGGLGELCKRLDVAPADAYGVASFYALFSLTEVPPRTVHVCTDIACAMAGGVAPGDLDDVAGARVVASNCLGLCERAPAALVIEAGARMREAVVAPASIVAVESAIEGGVEAMTAEPAVPAAVPQVGSEGLVLLRRVGAVDPWSLDAYRSSGGYEALRRAVQIGPAQVIEEVTASGLVGRGGAAFPAGRKWAAVAGQPVTTRYLVCNADESEPGTFKDRVLMEGDPFALIEAMTVAAYATGCEHGYIYLRGEYPRARHTLENAMAAARAAGLLGAEVMGAGFEFDVTLVRGAGAYICGEETAIFNSIEGYRGEPRSKPPFPVEVGLFGKPTLVNNVETLMNVLPIVLGGGAEFASVGGATSTGTKLFCVSGAVERPGVYEVPFGVTLGALLEMSGAEDGFRAVLLGGAAGSFVGPDALEMPLTFEGARARGASLGSGVVMVVGSAADTGAMLRRIAEFFRDESCGQCVPCRVGTVHQEKLIHAVTVGPRRDEDVGLLREVGQAMRDASICGLGQTAWNAIESALDLGLGDLGMAVPS